MRGRAIAVATERRHQNNSGVIRKANQKNSARQTLKVDLRVGADLESESGSAGSGTRKRAEQTLRELRATRELNEETGNAISFAARGRQPARGSLGPDTGSAAHMANSMKQCFRLRERSVKVSERHTTNAKTCNLFDVESSSEASTMQKYRSRVMGLRHAKNLLPVRAQ